MLDKADMDTIRSLKYDLSDYNNNEQLIMRALAYMLSHMQTVGDDPMSVALAEVLEERSKSHRG